MEFQTGLETGEVAYNALLTVYGSEKHVIDFSRLLENPCDENGREAAELIKLFEMRRHDYVGRIFGSYLEITHSQEMTVYRMLQIINGFLNLSIEESINLQSGCDINKTPDAMNISTNSETGRILVSVIDYKVRSNKALASIETKNKYANAITEALKRLGKCDVEILIMGMDPKNGDIYCDNSSNENLNMKFNEMYNDQTIRLLLDMVQKANEFIHKFDLIYQRFPEFRKHRHSSERMAISTEGHFTGKVKKLMDILFKCCKKDLETNNYNMDDIYRIDKFENSKIRLLLLFCEYYDLPIDDENFMEELKELIDWFEDKVDRNLNVKNAYRRLRRELNDFDSYIIAVQNNDIETMKKSLMRIKKYLDLMYKGCVSDEVDKLMKLKKDDLSSFRPSEPKLEDLKEGLQDCVKKIKRDQSKMFVHFSESQQSFNFLFPTKTCLSEMIEIQEETNLTSNSCKSMMILGKLTHNLRNCKNEKIETIDIGEHDYSKLDDIVKSIIQNDDYCKIYLLHRIKVKHGSQENYANSRLDKYKEYKDFVNLLDQVTPNVKCNTETLDPKKDRLKRTDKKDTKSSNEMIFDKDNYVSTYRDIQEYSELTNKKKNEFIKVISKNVKEGDLKHYISNKSQLDKNKRLIGYKDIITDGISMYIGKHRNKFINKCKIEYLSGDGGHKMEFKQGRPCDEYLIHSGVGKKERKKREESGLKTVTIQDIKEERDISYDDTSPKKGIKFKETRTKVLDFNCEECCRCSLNWQDDLIKMATIKDAPRETKLYKTSMEILNSSSHSECQDAVMQTKERLNVIYSSPIAYAAESISQLFEGLLVRSEHNKPNTISPIFCNSPDTILLKLPGEKLYNPNKTVPYIFIKKIKKKNIDDQSMSSIKLDIMNCDYIISQNDDMFMISKPQRIDLNRCNTLSKSEMRFLLACSTFFDTTLLGGKQNIKSCDIRKVLANSFRLTCTVSISQMSLRDPLKYLFTLALADASDIYGFLTEKFDYHIKSANDLSLFLDIKNLLEQLIKKREEIKHENQVRTKLTVSEDEVIDGGWLTFDIDSPFTGSKYKDVKQLINEILINVYFVQKELHNKITNLEKLVKVPCKFEEELKKYLSNDFSLDSFSKQHMTSHGCDRNCPELLMLNLDRFFFNKDTFSGDKPFSYDPKVLMLSCRERQKAESYKTTFLRPKIEKEEKLKLPIVSIDTLTSSKSSTTCTDSYVNKKVWKGNLKDYRSDIKRNVTTVTDKKLPELIKKRITSEILDVNNCQDTETLKHRINMWSSIEKLIQIKSRERKEEFKEVLDKIWELKEKIFDKVKEIKSKNKNWKFNLDKWKMKNINVNEEGYISNDLPFSTFELYMKFFLDDWIQTETLPVKEAQYSLLKNLKKGGEDIESISVVDICKIVIEMRHQIGLYNNELMPIVRMFPKGQRTFTDREIYIMDLLCKIQLYYIEHIYKHMNRINDFEAISLPGEAKPYYIGNQEIEFIINNQKLKTNSPDIEGENKYINHLNADESKWSARDVPLKFVDTHHCAVACKLSERLTMMMIQMSYMRKAVLVPTDIMQRLTLQQSKRYFGVDIKNEIIKCTKKLSRNYMFASFNWLQGNFNYLSSFVHTAVMEFLKAVHDEYIKKLSLTTSKKIYDTMTNFTSMVHSDDGTISTAVVLNDKTDISFMSRWISYPRFIFYITKVEKRKFAIELNLMKTFCSESIKDFISEFLINGEFIGNYARYIPNCCGDSNFKSFKEDVSMLMSAPQSMAKRGSTLETLLLSVVVVNYHVYHTYSMIQGELNDPNECFKILRNILKMNQKDIEDLKSYDEEVYVGLKRMIEGNHLKLQTNKFDRNKLSISLGGYCNPPLVLLALLGSKAHDSYILMESFKILMTTGKFDLLLNNPDQVTPITVKLMIDHMRKYSNMMPDFEILVSSFIIRQEMGHINAKYSKFDVNRLNHINILTFPQMKNEESFPIRYPSYRTFLQNIKQGSQHFFENIKLLVENPKNITGACNSSSIFLRRIELDYQISKRVDVFQTLGTAIQRLCRISQSNHRLFLPINIIDGLEKIKLSESLQDFEDDKLSLLDSKVQMIKGQIAALKLLRTRYRQMEGRKYYEIDPIFTLNLDINKANKELQETLKERDNLREKHDRDLILSKTKLGSSLYLLAEILRGEKLNQVSSNSNNKISKVSNLYNPSHARNHRGLYENMEVEENRSKSNSPLRMKMTLGESILFVILLASQQDRKTLTESYIYTMLATVFNDRIVNFFVKMNMATIKTLLEGRRTATLQKIVYPYQIRPLSFRTEDIVKCILLPDEDVREYRETMQIDDPAFEVDIHYIENIIEDIELKDVVENVKERLTRYRFLVRVDEKVMFELLTTIRRFNILYNVLLKAVSMYTIKQAYALSRSNKTTLSFTFFQNYKGNFIFSEQYVQMEVNKKILDDYHLNIYTPAQSSLWELKQVLDSIIALTNRCQRIVGKEFSPLDLIYILENSRYNGEIIWKYLLEHIDEIQKKLYDLRQYIPLLYHLGLVRERDITTKIDDQEVLAIWHQSHAQRAPMLGNYHVEYRYKRILVVVNGRDNLILYMNITVDDIYNNVDMYKLNMLTNLSVILGKIAKDLKFTFESAKGMKIKGTIYFKHMRGDNPDEFSIVTDKEDGQYWTKKEEMTIMQSRTFAQSLSFVFNKLYNLEHTLVDFYKQDSRTRDLLELYMWRLTEGNDELVYDGLQSENMYVDTMFCGPNVPYNLMVPHNNDGYIPLDPMDDLRKYQSLHSKCKRSPQEKIVKLELLSEKDIEVNGLNLRLILNTLKTVEESTLHKYLFPMSELENLIPSLKEVYRVITTLQYEAITTEIILYNFNAVMQCALVKAFEGEGDRWIKDLEDKTINWETNVYRHLLATSKYKSLVVNILSKFPTSSINLLSILGDIILTVINDPNLDKLLRRGSVGMYVLSTSRVGESMIDCLELCLHLNNLELHPNPRCKEVKTKIISELLKFVNWLIALLYLLFIKEVMEKLDKKIFTSDRVLEINSNFQKRILKIVNDASLKYANNLPKDSPVPRIPSKWKQNPVPQAYKIMTKENFLLLKIDDRNYAEYIKSKVLEYYNALSSVNDKFDIKLLENISYISIDEIKM